MTNLHLASILVNKLASGKDRAGICGPAGTVGGGDPASTGQTYSVLYAFTGAPDGAQSQAGLLRDAKGSLYGTTPYGGDSTCNYPSGCGVVFTIDTAGKEIALYSFDHRHGQYPFAGLVRDAKGNLYGTTDSVVVSRGVRRLTYPQRASKPSCVTSKRSWRIRPCRDRLGAKPVRKVRSHPPLDARLGMQCGPTSCPCATGTIEPWSLALPRSAPIIPLITSAVPISFAAAVSANGWDM